LETRPDRFSPGKLVCSAGRRYDAPRSKVLRRGIRFVALRSRIVTDQSACVMRIVTWHTGCERCTAK
jgi:hypothetical protein